uniref:PPFIA binding protein 1 n=1 Tax=Oncorhynchus kisutch TaxID=8019 RepID=A0A8C7K7N6_ONCKI
MVSPAKHHHTTTSMLHGSKAMGYSNGLFDCQSPTSPFLGSLRALHLLEDLRAALEMMDQDEREGLRCQVPDTTADGLVEWLQQGQLTNGNDSAMIYQDRLSRVESDKECLVLQVSVLSDQVEVQGEKIRDLDMCLEEHREKLDATEETLQQEFLTRSTLETQKLELMTEVSSLKLKLTTVARDRRDSEVHGCIMGIDSPSQRYHVFGRYLEFRSTAGRRLIIDRGFAVTRGQSMAGYLGVLCSGPSRLKRSHSTSLDLEETEFRRGGVRATAGPRLGCVLALSPLSDVDAPFAQWSKEQVCLWLHEQGLGLQVAQAQQWICSGFTLLQASQHDLEKELGIKQPLHRKKLQLALQALGSEEDVSKAKLDHNWVTRWLDDIGLPQYKSQFDEGRVDGRMLHYMTVDDLLSLKVGSVLHHLSIKRAIQVLRLNFYEPNCLRRRPSDENNITPAEISQWTNHRVMEWLRSVDLAEYAPNLRGSGVHGGVMVLEPRFNVESLALLLNIPPNKTLLRRHLATHFHLLIGSAAQHSKQECLENPDYTLLTATAKVKPRRLSFGGFGTLRKKRQEDSEEYVCPMDVEMPKNSSFQGGLRSYEDDLDQLEQVRDCH